MENNQHYYNESVDKVLQDLKSTPTGLTKSEVDRRQTKYGENRLAQKRQTTIGEKFINQFKDFMIVVLMVAALIAGFSGEIADAVIIMLVVILNAAFGVFQESKAENAINALREMSAPDAHVKRDGKVATVKSTELVPGDIVLLEAGDIVPADLRLIDVGTLQVEESALTGESVPTDKTVAAFDVRDLPIGDRKNMAYMNTNVTYGRAEGVVVRIGMATEVGQIATMIDQTDDTKTPLQENLHQLGKTLTVLILIIASLVFIIGMLRGKETLINMMLTAISLAVAAIPEGLPAIVTITLALGTTRMARQNALIRKLPAVETLGSTDIIASDKTGTLTQNKMTVEKIYENGRLADAMNGLDKNSLLAKVMVLANDAQITEEGLIGDPTETALLQYNLDQGYPVRQILLDNTRQAEISFDSQRKLMTTIYPEGKQSFVAVKGAPDELLKCVTKVSVNGKVQDLDGTIRRKILQKNHEMAQQALRVLAFAYKTMVKVPDEITPKNIENNLVFVGLIGMIDPERPEAKTAIANAKTAGIRTIMITGDHRDTAQAIARRLGMIDEHQQNAVITGAELDEMDDATFTKDVGRYLVYARVAPEHKVRIVKAWQQQGKVVAMTGDGVNDAPALKTADIGVGMGITGTEVAKGASDMVLADDNFATIVAAVKEGRKVFANIQKAIQYLLSANLGEVVTLVIMTIFGWNILAPVQILWINLVTDTFPAIALGVEPAEKNIMQRKPRGRNSNFLSGGVFSSILYQGLLEAALTLLVYFLGINFPIHSGTELIHADALTMTFATLGLLQLFHAFNTKSLHQSIFSRVTFQNKTFNWSILLAFILLVITILVPGLNDVFHVSYLDLVQWLTVISVSFAIIPIVELVKFIQRKVYRLD